MATQIVMHRFGIHQFDYINQVIFTNCLTFAHWKTQYVCQNDVFCLQTLYGASLRPSSVHQNESVFRYRYFHAFGIARPVEAL